MKIAAISDIHVKSPHDEADKLLHRFLNHPKVQNSDCIILLGDIFDLMCGPHKEYLSSYDHIFKSITELKLKGKEIIFFEGNHDVHLKMLFQKIWPKDEVILSQDPIIKEINGRKYYFSHGDEHEVDNLSYQRYIKFIRSAPLRFIANFIIPFYILNYFGQRASKLSRKKGYKKFDAELVRQRFRKGVELVTQSKFDFVIGGHSHVQDEYTFQDKKSVYLNNGYALKTRTFIYIDNHIPSFIPLD